MTTNNTTFPRTLTLTLVEKAQAGFNLRDHQGRGVGIATAIYCRVTQTSESQVVTTFVTLAHPTRNGVTYGPARAEKTFATLAEAQKAAQADVSAYLTAKRKNNFTTILSTEI